MYIPRFIWCKEYYNRKEEGMQEMNFIFKVKKLISLQNCVFGNKTKISDKLYYP